MLSFQLLKNCAGILLCGDYTAMKALHDAVHEANEKSPLIRDKEGTFLGLAYDVRKAYEGQRQVLEPPELFPELGVRYGVEVLWPVILLQCRMLRTSLAYFDSSKEQQAITYSLESVLEEALGLEFKADAPALLEAWNNIDPAHPWAEEKLNSRGALFCSWSKGVRQKKLWGLLVSLNPLYPIIYEDYVENGIPELLSPEAMDAWETAEWADPRW